MRVPVILVGAGGFAGNYLQRLPTHAEARLAAVVDPAPERLKPELRALAGDAPWYTTLEEALVRCDAPLVIISSPIQFHAQQTLACLAAGRHVLVEKPLAGDLAEAEAMVAAAASSGRICALGYQWSYSPAVQRLRARVASGSLGRPRRLAALALWPRGAWYFSRNRWVGRLRDDAGRAVCDSPVMNACAHFLHNALEVLGAASNGAAAAPAMPQRVAAQAWRRHPDLETFDAAAVRVGTADGGEALLYAAHCVPSEVGPLLRYEFDHAVLTYGMHNGAHFRLHFRDGRIEDLGSPDDDAFAKIGIVARAVAAGDPGAIPCPVAHGLPHLRAALGVQQELGEDIARDASLTASGTDGVLIWPRLDALLTQAFSMGVLPREL